MEFFTSQALVSGFVLLVATVICAIMRRASAAQRHLVWSSAFLCVLAIPVFAMLVAPLVPAPKSQATSPVVIVSAEIAQAAPANGDTRTSVPWKTVAAGLWGAGAALLLLRIGVGIAVCTHRKRRAIRFDLIEPVARRLAGELGISCPDVRITSRVSVPETFGLRRPCVLLPDHARNWTPDRTHVVLLHEFVHIQRHDWAIHMIARVASAFFWFNPLCWYALARLRDERELACDDEVLHFGVRQSDYAYQLIEIAKNLQGRPDALVVAMARASHMEVRIRAILNPERNRRRLTLKDRCLTLIPAVLLVAAASLVTAPAQTGNASISGIVRDPSGAVVPEAKVIISDGRGQETVRTNEVGKFEFSGFPDGKYSLKVLKPGFREFAKPDIEASAAAPVQLNVTLDVGRISESVQVVAQGQARPQPTRPATSFRMQREPPRPPPPPPARTDTAPEVSGPKRIRVGGNIQPARLLNRVLPQYPQHLIAQGVEGTVLLVAVIGMNGQVLGAEVKNSQVDPDLIQAAIDAVKQWRYEPTLLNGQPVELVTTITVEFRLKP
jgi:TonB family protein